MKKLLKKLTKMESSLSKMTIDEKVKMSGEIFKSKRKMYTYLRALFWILIALKAFHIPPVSWFDWWVVFTPLVIRFVIMAIDVCKYVSQDDKKDDK